MDSVKNSFLLVIDVFFVHDPSRWILFSNKNCQNDRESINLLVNICFLKSPRIKKFKISKIFFNQKLTVYFIHEVLVLIVMHVYLVDVCECPLSESPLKFKSKLLNF